MAATRCEECGTTQSRFVPHPPCPACATSSGTPIAPGAPARCTPSTALLWAATGPGGGQIAADLADVLKSYRRANGLSQRQLAALLDFDQSYVSLLERRRRRLGDRDMLAHIARRLSIPSHVFGITEVDDADYVAMVQFADSTIRLAEIARQTGRVTEAVNELWPLVARLERRVTDGRVDRQLLALLARARMALGVALGNVLPDQYLFLAARWTGKALRLVGQLDDAALYARALRMHGNELRKTGRTSAAIAWLGRALRLANEPVWRAEALTLLARAAGEAGMVDVFDRAARECRRLLGSDTAHTNLFNPFSVREVILRGLMDIGRSRAAVALANDGDLAPADTLVGPQWRVIERVTFGQVLVLGGEATGAVEALQAAVATAERCRLPHQIQRAIRVAGTMGGAGGPVAESGQAALDRLSRCVLPDHGEPPTPSPTPPDPPAGR